MTPNRASRSRACQCPPARRPASSPAAASKSEPVQTLNTYLAFAASRCAYAIQPSSSMALSIPGPPGTTRMSDGFALSRVCVGRIVRPRSVRTGSIDAATRSTVQRGMRTSTSKAPVVSSWHISLTMMMLICMACSAELIGLRSRWHDMSNRRLAAMSKTEQKMPKRTVVIFAYDGAQLIDIAGPTQALTTANEEGALPPYAVRLASVAGGPIRTASGVKLIADPLPRGITIDTLLVPGGPGVHTFRKDRKALAALQRLCMRSRRICAVCTGAFALAEIGLLNKRRVVTHWRSCAQLAEEFPEVCVDPEPLFIQAGKVWTTAGVTAGIDLTLTLIEQDHSAALATSVARRLVVYMKRPGGQQQYSEPLELQRGASEPYDSLLQTIASRPAASWDIEMLAEG